MKRVHALLVAVVIVLLLAWYVSASLKPPKTTPNEEPKNETQQTPAPSQNENETHTRPVYYFFYSSTCPACELMEEQTLSNEAVLRSLEANFTYKRINTATNRALVQRYLVQYVPTNVFTYPDGTEMGRYVGAVAEPDRFLQMLDDVLEFYDDHPQPA